MKVLTHAAFTVDDICHHIDRFMDKESAEHRGFIIQNIIDKNWYSLNPFPESVNVVRAEPHKHIVLFEFEDTEEPTHIEDALALFLSAKIHYGDYPVLLSYAGLDYHLFEILKVETVAASDGSHAALALQVDLVPGV